MDEFEQQLALISRRRLLAWIGGVTATVAGAGLLSACADSQESATTRSAGDSGSGSDVKPELRLHSLLIPVGLMKHMKGKEWTYASPLGELPMIAHTKETWKQFADGNGAAARLVDGPYKRFYVADKADTGKLAKVPFQSNVITPYAVYAKNKFNLDQIWTVNYSVPHAALRQVAEAALKVHKSVEKAFQKDQRLHLLGLPKGNIPTSIEEVLGLEDIPSMQTASAMSMLFSYPATMLWDPTGAASTANIIYSTGGLADVVTAIQGFLDQGLPFGNMEQMVKRANADGTFVPETLDPRVGGTQFDWPKDEGAAPPVPDHIGSQPATYFAPFVLDGAKYGQQGLEQDVPPELIQTFRATFKSANIKVTNAIADTPALGSIQPADKPAQTLDQLNGNLKGKSWQVNYENKPQTITAGPPQASANNSGPVKFSITTAIPAGGMHLELKDVKRDTSGATKITVRIYNNVERYVTLAAQFFDGRNLPMQPPDTQCMADSVTNDWTWNVWSDAMLPPVPLIMGIPIEGFTNMNYRDLDIFMPINSDQSKSKTAQRVRIVAGTSGSNYSSWRNYFTYLKLDDKGNEILDSDGKPIVLQSYPDHVSDSDDVQTTPQWYQSAILSSWTTCVGLPMILLLVQGMLVGISRKSLKGAKNTSEVKQYAKKFKEGFDKDPYVLEMLADEGLDVDGFIVLMDDGFRVYANAARWALGAIPLFTGAINAAMGVSNSTTRNAHSNGWNTLISVLPKLILNLIQWYVFTSYFKSYLAGLATAETTKAIPIIGEIFMAAAIGADLSQISQAAPEILTDQNTGIWEIVGTYPVTLTLSPQNATFSPEAATWYVEVLYQGQSGIAALDSDVLKTETKGYTQFPADIQHVTPPGFKVYTDSCGNLMAAHCPDFPGTDSDPFCASGSPTPTPTTAPSAPRSDPLKIQIPEVKFGTPVQFVFHLLSPDAWDVGSWTSQVYTNTDLDKVVTDIKGVVGEAGIQQSGATQYERSSTSAVKDGEIQFLSGQSVPGTIHSAPDIVPGSIVVGRGTGLASYVMQQNGTWFVRQLMTSEHATDSEMAQTWRGERPWLAVDQIAKLGKGTNWLLEPIADDGSGNGGYHVRSLNLDPKSFNFDTKKTYGRFLAPLTHMTMSPSGHLLGVHANTGKLAILFPDLVGSHPEADKAPIAFYHAGPGNASGQRPGLLNKPVGVVVAGNGVVAVLEQGSQRLQAFSVRGNPMKAFQVVTSGGPTGDPDYYSHMPPANESQSELTFLDVTSDTSQGFIFVLSYLGDGQSSDDYVIDVFAPGSPQRLYRMKGFNSGKFTSDPYRNLYASNFQAIGTLSGAKASKQPSTSIWIARTPHKVKGGPKS